MYPLYPPPPPPEALGIANVDYYYYLNQSGTYTVDGTDDKKEFDDTVVSPGVRGQSAKVVEVIVHRSQVLEVWEIWKAS